MRTTIDIPDGVFRRAKALAAMEGKTLKAFVLDALTHELAIRKEGKRSSKRVKLPLVKSKHPGSLRLTGDAIAGAIEDEDVGALTGR